MLGVGAGPAVDCGCQLGNCRSLIEVGSHLAPVTCKDTRPGLYCVWSKPRVHNIAHQQPTLGHMLKIRWRILLCVLFSRQAVVTSGYEIVSSATRQRSKCNLFLMYQACLCTSVTSFVALHDLFPHGSSISASSANFSAHKHHAAMKGLP